MRYIILLLSVAVTCAQYDYQPTHQAGDSTLSYSIPNNGLNDVTRGSNPSPGLTSQSAVQKEFYIYTARDDDFSDNEGQQAVNLLKKNLRVVFIQNPENRALEKAALALAKQAGEQKTAIYVLNKQTDIHDLARKLNNISLQSSNKPEVHFVKYRTPEDAAHARRTIQDEYDALGGNSKTIDGGIAPVVNFVSSTPTGFKSSSISALKEPGNSFNPSVASHDDADINSYLPPADEQRQNYNVPSDAINTYRSSVPTDVSSEHSHIPQTTSKEADASNSNNAPVDAINDALSNSYVPPAPASNLTDHYNSPIPFADSGPNSYLPPLSTDEGPGTSYLPANIYRLFRL